ncbi:hypothetical protein [Demequina lignilytica]|uniref:Uncharacterized protein n=1 Tax=Demequina lignilytica TaxID=3051663 RepID=A0AB35MJL7_9MICO|nr:hypothetical protein [Demequina sp. SYSU T0a273]MDN4484019.1 hypothetical protein [Demequina sp. SYSU T0a273]
MSSNWSLLLPGVIVAIVAGITIGGTIDIGRRTAELRARQRRFEAEGPLALAAAHDLLVAGIPRDPSSLVPPEAFVRPVRDQVATLQLGSRRAKSELPAIAMLDGLDRLLEEMTVRGRMLDTALVAAFSKDRTEAETRFMLKLARQAIQRDPQPAGDEVPEIDSEPVNAILEGDADLRARIVQYRHLQERLFNVADAFVDHWWVVRGLRLDAAARTATATLEGGPVARWRVARDIDRKLHADIVHDFLPRWQELTAALGKGSAAR